MNDTWNAAGYIASSRYRLAVCEYLSDRGPGLPSEIAAETDLAQPHVSRALSELRELDVVELLVPESQQKGRLYGLTDSGRIALDRLSRGRDAVDLRVVARDGFPYDRLVTYLEERHRAAAQAVAVYDGEVARVHFFGGEPADSRSAPIVQLWERSRPSEDLTTGTAGSHEFTVYGLETVTLLEFTEEDDDRHIGVSLDEDADVPVRSFVDALEAQIRN